MPSRFATESKARTRASSDPKAMRCGLGNARPRDGPRATTVSLRGEYNEPNMAYSRRCPTGGSARRPLLLAEGHRPDRLRRGPRQRHRSFQEFKREAPTLGIPVHLVQQCALSRSLLPDRHRLPRAHDRAARRVQPPHPPASPPPAVPRAIRMAALDRRNHLFLAGDLRRLCVRLHLRLAHDPHRDRDVPVDQIHSLSAGPGTVRAEARETALLHSVQIRKAGSDNPDERETQPASAVISTRLIVIASAAASTTLHLGAD